MRDTTILDGLERMAAKEPSRIAFIDPDKEITFADLVRCSRRVGTFLAGKITRRSPVAFYMEKSVDALCAMFGAVYAGGFYSFVDVRQPAARAEKALSVLKPAVLFYSRAQAGKAASLSVSCPKFCLEDVLNSLPDADEAALAAIRDGLLDTDPLYVNFTSGSTGTPKGVAVCHRSVLDFIPFLVQISGISESDILGNQAPFDFDVSVKDIYTTLYTGAATVLIPREYFSAPTTLMDYICDHEVTSLCWAVSAMCFVSIMNGFGYRVPCKVRNVMFSGEVMPIRQLNVWQKFLPHTRYINLYGPTEITCNCTYYVLDRSFEKNEIIPIGRPFPNERVFLLDENDRPVTDAGIEGEICVCGTALALGYWNDPERTAQVFVQNPLNKAFPERMYRTGDLGAYDADGNLVYHTRKDFQIKQMGQRIELGEIEAAAMALDGVSRAACVYDPAKKKILLFYTGEKEESTVKKELGVNLPPYMMPGKTARMDFLPMNKNGKIDRGALLSMAVPDFSCGADSHEKGRV